VIREYGERAVLVDHDEPLRLWAALRDVEGLEDVVPAARTVLVVGDHARQAVASVLAGPLPPYSPPESVVEIPVVYDGVDLADINGLPPDEVVALHTAATYTVAFLGFAPGFPYCTGLDARLHAPRLATPRTVVPAGSVAIAGEWCAIYPTASPGGWRLIGHTDVSVFDASLDPPTLLAPGWSVRFVDVGASASK
jgi:KipI family sensor histidine kinase inhibitor